MLTKQALPALCSSTHPLHENSDLYSALTQDRDSNHTNMLPPLVVLPVGQFSSREDLPIRRRTMSASQSEILAGSTMSSRSPSLLRDPRSVPRFLSSSRSTSSLNQRHRLLSVAPKSKEFEESPKFKLRRARIQEMERLQELEDEREFDKRSNLVRLSLRKITRCSKHLSFVQHVLHSLLTSQPFSEVTATFEDLDGQGYLWEECSMRRVMRERWVSIAEYQNYRTSGSNCTYPKESVPQQNPPH
jgi:hypothetical protein